MSASGNTRTRAPLGSAKAFLSSNNNSSQALTSDLGRSSPLPTHLPSSSYLSSGKRTTSKSMAARMKGKAANTSARIASENREVASHLSSASTAKSIKKRTVDTDRETDRNDNEPKAMRNPLGDAQSTQNKRSMIVAAHQTAKFVTSTLRQPGADHSDGDLDSVDLPATDALEISKRAEAEANLMKTVEKLQTCFTVRAAEFDDFYHRFGTAWLEDARAHAEELLQSAENTAGVTTHQLLKTPSRARSQVIRPDPRPGNVEPAALDLIHRGQAQRGSQSESDAEASDDGDGDDTDKDGDFAGAKAPLPVDSPIKPRPRVASSQAKSSIRSLALSSNADTYSSVKSKGSKASSSSSSKRKPKATSRQEESDIDVEPTTAESGDEAGDDDISRPAAKTSTRLRKDAGKSATATDSQISEMPDDAAIASSSIRATKQTRKPLKGIKDRAAEQKRQAEDEAEADAARKVEEEERIERQRAEAKAKAQVQAEAQEAARLAQDALEKDRLEAARVAAERMEHERLEKEEQEAREQAEAVRLQAAVEAEAAAAAAAKAKADVAAAAERERKRAERERKAAEKKRADEEKARQREEELQRRKQAEREAQEKAEAERVEKEKKAKDEAERKRKEEAAEKRQVEAERKKREKEELEAVKQKEREQQERAKAEAEAKKAAVTAASAAKEADEEAEQIREADKACLAAEAQAKANEEARIAAAQAQAEADVAAEAEADAENADVEDSEDDDASDGDDDAKDNDADADGSFEVVADNDAEEIEEGQLEDEAMPDEMIAPSASEYAVAQAIGGHLGPEPRQPSSAGAGPSAAGSQQRTSSVLIPGQSKPAKWTGTPATTSLAPSAPSAWKRLNIFGFHFGGAEGSAQGGPSEPVATPTTTPSGPQETGAAVNVPNATSSTAASAVQTANSAAASTVRPHGLPSLATSKSGIPASGSRVASQQASKAGAGTSAAKAGTLGRKKMAHPYVTTSGKGASAAAKGATATGSNATSKIKKVASPLKKLANVGGSSARPGTANTEEVAAVKKRKVSPTISKVTATASERAMLPPSAPASPIRKGAAAIFASTTSKIANIPGSKSKITLSQQQQQQPNGTLVRKMSVNGNVGPFSQQNDFQQGSASRPVVAGLRDTGSNPVHSRSIPQSPGVVAMPTPYFSQQNDFQQVRTVSGATVASTASTSSGRSAASTVSTFSTNGKGKIVNGMGTSAVPQRFSSLNTATSGSQQTKSQSQDSSQRTQTQRKKSSIPQTPKIQTLAKRRRYNDPNLEDANVSLPDIQSEYSDSEDETTQRKRKREAEWMRGEGLEAALHAQLKFNADDLFGDFDPNSPPDLNRMMPPLNGVRPRQIPRSSSANWAGPEELMKMSMERHTQLLKQQQQGAKAGPSSSAAGPSRPTSSTAARR